MIDAFSQYGFDSNPFSIDSFDHEMRGREKEWKKIEDLLKESLEDKGNKTIILLGDYQIGKTFTLNRILKGLNEKEFAHSEKTISASIKLAESEPETKIGFSLVTKIFYKIGFPKLSEISKKAAKKRIKLDRTFTNAFLSLGKGREESEIAFDWFCGETLSSPEKKKIGVKKKISSSSDALKILYEFEKMLKLVGYDNLVVLIDEFEYLVNQYSELQITRTLHTFKEIHDKFIEENTEVPNSIVNFILIIAMTPRSWYYLIDLEKKGSKTGGGGISPWMERLRPEKYVMEIVPLKKEELRAMLKDRIQEHRKSYEKIGGWDTFPFVSPGFFDVIHEVSQGIPGRALKWGDLVISGAAKKELKKIGKEETKNILKEFHIVN